MIRPSLVAGAAVTAVCAPRLEPGNREIERRQTLDASSLPFHRLVMADLRTESDTDRAALIGAVAASADHAAFIALFEFYAPRIKAQAMRYGVTADVAEDIAQEAMLSLWRRAGQFDPARGSASAWVFTIATNARIDRMRRDRRLAGAVEIDAESPLLSVDPVEPSGADAVRLARLVDGLPEEQRRILHLSFFSDVPHSDIAKRLGLPLGTVKSRIRLAIAKLRQALRDDQ